MSQNCQNIFFQKNFSILQFSHKNKQDNGKCIRRPVPQSVRQERNAHFNGRPRRRRQDDDPVQVEAGRDCHDDSDYW